MENIQEEKEQQQQQSFGKFATAEELLAAYNALESEFTKRCQLVKELQARLDTPDAQTVQPEVEVRQCVSDEQSELELQERASRHVTPEELIGALAADIDGYLDALCTLPQVMDECVARYKQALLSAEFGMPSVRGTAVLTPVNRPRTLVDAKRIADRMLKQ